MMMMMMMTMMIMMVMMMMTSRRTNTAKMSVDRSCQLRQKTRLRRVWSLALWIFQSSFDVDDDYHDADDDYDWAFNDYDDAFYNLQLEGGLWSALGRCQNLWAKKRSCCSITSYSTSNRHLNPSESIRTIGLAIKPTHIQHGKCCRSTPFAVWLFLATSSGEDLAICLRMISCGRWSNLFDHSQRRPASDQLLLRDGLLQKKR